MAYQRQKDNQPDLGGYTEVSDLMREFYARYPGGRLGQLRDPIIVTVPTQMKRRHFESEEGWRDVIENGHKVYDAQERTYIVFTAAAWRTDDDPHPGVGTAWEPVAGETPYTFNSEMMNAETSAWGRAIRAVGILKSGESIATREEIAARRAEHDDKPATQTSRPAEVKLTEEDRKLIVNRLSVLDQLAENLPKGKGESWFGAKVTQRAKFYREKQHMSHLEALDAVMLEMGEAHAKVCKPAAGEMCEHLTDALPAWKGEENATAAGA